MNERTIWIVRILGVAMLLVMLYLLLSLQTKLRRLQSETPPAATATTPSS